MKIKRLGEARIKPMILFVEKGILTKDEWLKFKLHEEIEVTEEQVRQIREIHQMEVVEEIKSTYTTTTGAEIEKAKKAKKDKE